MIWTRQQVQDVERLAAKYVASEEALEKGGEQYVVHLGTELFNTLKEMAYTSAVELDIQDLRFRWIEDSGPGGMRIKVLTARWDPDTTTALLVGGPYDGKTYAVPREDLRRQRLATYHSELSKDIFRSSDEPLPQVDIGQGVVEYEWSGWHEEYRMWTYAPVEK